MHLKISADDNALSPAAAAVVTATIDESPSANIVAPAGNSAEGVYVLGVDGGNSKTIALIADLEGRIVAAGRSGCSDIYGAPSVDAALKELDHAVLTARLGANTAQRQVVYGTFSLAGADWPEDFALLEEALSRRGYARTVQVVNDAVGALRAGSPDSTGVCVVCGTGAAIAARSPHGAVWHSSWWQEPQGSRHLAQKTLRAIYRAELGIDRPTTLTARVLRALGTERVEDVLHAFTSRSTPAPSTDTVTRALLDGAHDGDATARRIVHQHGAALGDYATAAARRVEIETTPFRLVLSGGVFRHPSSVLRDALVARVRRRSPDVTPLLSRFEPAVGSLLMALEAAGVVISPALMRHLEASLPPASFFAT